MEVRRGNQRVCAVCARVLDWWEDSNDPANSKWDHSLQDMPADHLPVPVLPDEITAHYRCDFCNEDNTAPGWIVPANDFEMPGMQGMRMAGSHDMSSGDWAACDTCEKLVAANEWAELIKRVSSLSSAKSGMPQHELAVRLARIYHRLRANITGEPFRLEGGA